MQLTKTDFLIWRDCAHNAWLKIHRPHIYHAKPLSTFDQGIIETGNEVDALARDLFPGGELIARGDTQRTQALVAAHAPVLYQPVFETDCIAMVCDVLVWNSATERYDLFEVKASTNGEDKKAKDELYTHDLGFQAEVLRQKGIDIGRLHLVRLNSAYVRGESLDIADLFTREDFTERVTAALPALATAIATAHSVLSQPTPLPAPCNCITRGRNAYCTTFAYTNPNVPAYSIHDIARIGTSRKKLEQLVDRNILAIVDVPADFPLSDAQRNQVNAALSGRPVIDDAAIDTFLATMRYPLTFLDYETYPCGVPRFAGYSPFDQIPFQFSLDVIDQPGGKTAHHEFLFSQSGCPDEAFAYALATALPASGSIVVWNKRFEMGINDKLARRVPRAAALLTALNDRVIDLMEVFASQAYLHPAFRGSASIKAVLPALVPTLSYKELAIQEGGTASDTWNRIVSGALVDDDAAQAREALLRYCALDTRAMIEIWRVLSRPMASREVAPASGATSAA
jgi:hypothetical protein